MSAAFVAFNPETDRLYVEIDTHVEGVAVKLAISGGRFVAEVWKGGAFAHRTSGSSVSEIPVLPEEIDPDQMDAIAYRAMFPDPPADL